MHHLALHRNRSSNVHSHKGVLAGVVLPDSAHCRSQWTDLCSWLRLKANPKGHALFHCSLGPRASQGGTGWRRRGQRKALCRDAHVHGLWWSDCWSNQALGKAHWVANDGVTLPQLGSLTEDEAKIVCAKWRPVARDENELRARPGAEPLWDGQRQRKSLLW